MVLNVIISEEEIRVQKGEILRQQLSISDQRKQIEQQIAQLQIVKNAGYNGYIGIEYEGQRLSELEGVIATRNLLINAAKELK